jgi:hypothetical protein
MATLTGKTIGELALLTGITSDTLFAVELSGATYHIPYSGLSTGGGSYEEVTYDELYSMYTGSTLTPGGYYLITDFQSIYDQPDFDYDGNPIITGNSKTGITEQLLVFATSESTLADKVYSLDYPYDKLTYDINFTTTEISNTPAKGRITERIDEFNNRTDYDHRTILFKRYKLYTTRQELPLNGQIEVLLGGIITGQSTSFTLLSVGDVIYVPNNNLLYEITGISGDTEMLVSGVTIQETFGYYDFYSTIEETNDSSGYFSYKRNNIQIDDFVENTTFGDAISNEYAKNNYIGNHANNYQNEGNGFLLSNNVFLEGQYESNKFGDYCYNNTWGTDNENNTWGDFCYNNVSTNDIDRCTFGNYFRDNLINTNLNRNIIGNNFRNNRLLAENDEDFRENTIADGFINNTIYSEFYDNTINVGFEDNIIGDYVSLTDLRFDRNYIGNYFNNNIIRQDFQNNDIATNFNENEINGDFVGNKILNGFNNNETGYDFRLNNIGNGFNNNLIYDDFNQNTTKYYFYSNIISNDFTSNDVGSYFENNQPSNFNLFGWNDLSTISARTYDTLYNSLNGNVGNYILGKELIMKVISTPRYFKIKFRQWTQGGNGGGFQYERTELDSNGNAVGLTIVFTKTNGGNEVDVVVPGVVELSRLSQGGLYNTITDTNPPFNNQWPGPGDTEWNSIYTVNENGERFGYNKIGNNFYNNTIGNDFGYGGGNNYGNVIGEEFQNNTIGEYCYNNNISNLFQNNTVGDYFQWNVINTPIISTNFITYYDTITGFTYSASGSSASDNTYNGLTGATNGSGVDATFNVVVSSSAVTSVTIVQTGNYYQVNDTITILGSQIGGTDGIDDVIITITQIIEPSVYESYTCKIFERQGGDKRLSYYDSNDVLTITDINI